MFLDNALNNNFQGGNAHLRMAEPEYIQELKQLQHKIMNLQDSNDLQQGEWCNWGDPDLSLLIYMSTSLLAVVEIIAATGLYEIADATKTFDFDLCVLNAETVQRLKDFFHMRIK